MWGAYGMPEEHLSFDEFLDQLRKASQNTSHQGLQFELAMVALLPHLPEYEFEKAWLWKKWLEREAVTGLNAQDIGIDIVVRLRDREEYWAVQCKFYDPKSTITHQDLGTFYTASGREGFSGRLIITTTDNWTDHAENMLEGQQIETHRLRLKDLKGLNIGWNWVRPDKTRVIESKKKGLYPRQKEALQKAKSHYADHERGQLIMACGTGKTFTSLKIAEKIVPRDGYVLFVVPSLSLMRQTIMEWSLERSRGCRYLGICSDSTVGKDDESNTNVADISVPVSTDPNRIASILKDRPKSERMTVVFCTYQSLDRLHEAQKMGVPEFNLIICDEAHRTTGVDRESGAGGNRSNSNFVKIHEQDFIKGNKRLYMTATPRIYTDDTRSKASDHNLGVYSMDDEAQFGKEFYRLGFSAAERADMLSDYRVIVLTMSQDYISDLISQLDKETIATLDPTTDDVAKIIGCYKALRDQGKDKGGSMLKRAVSFSSSIKNSKMVVDKFSSVVANLDAIENDGFTCQLDHVDGKQNALARANKLDWLRDDVDPTDDGEVCRILSNARCLTEGVDVPSLDAVLFMNPRKSQVDVVQAVGRVMRKAQGKKYGYVILPVVVPAGESVEEALNRNEVFGVIWEVLRALRAHDDRLTNYVSQLELNEKKPENIRVVGIGFSDDGKKTGTDKPENGAQLQLGFPEELEGLIHAKIVDKVGDKRYLEQWAKDTAELHDLLVGRIDGLRKEHPEVEDIYTRFLTSLKATIHDGLDEGDATSMLAQQLITRPIFDTLFEGYQFSQNNVVSEGLDNVLSELEEYGLDKELEPLTGFYESVKSRVSELDNDTARQTVITELYEKFFTTAFPKTSESLGIAYTPMELVDFTLKSADEVMREEFGRGLTDEGVHVIDPFTGTGSFLVRLLNNPDLILDGDLHRKFTGELWANEILLLAYYIASVNIEMAYHQREQRQYQAFPGISLTDTFELFERDEDQFPVMLEANSDRITAQRNAPIRVVVGNPPWSAGQRSQNDNNANRVYPALDESIRGSYAKRSNTTLVNGLYDSYIRAIRWASDRIGAEGVVAFVIPYAWMDRSFADGMRFCLEEEFDAIWLFDLRGDIRKNMLSKGTAKEGENVFGQKTQNGVCVSLFIKNPAKHRTKAEIHYHDIGDDRKRDAKFEIIRNAGGINGLEWKTITPNPEGDWLNQRDPKFEFFVELGNDEVKRGKIARPETIFRSYSNGIVTRRDAWVYNFSKDNVTSNMERMIDAYNEQVVLLTEAKKQTPNIDPDTVLDVTPTRINWDSTLKTDAKKGHKGAFHDKHIIRSLYRPFTVEYLYFDRQFNSSINRLPSYFPTPEAENQLICVTAKGARSEFSCLITDTVPNLHTLDTGQTFPRWVYRKDDTTGKQVREDNITNHAETRFQTLYKDPSITKDRIFDYVYGILHAPDYRERFANDLRLGLPRIPMADDFRAFADAGAALAHLHLGWTLDGDPLARTDLGVLFNDEATFPEMIPENAWKVQKMRFIERNEGKFIKYNQNLSIGPIPEEAFRYTIGNRTPLQWIIDRYQVKKDKDSGIINDPNDWIAEQHYPPPPPPPNGRPRPDSLVELIRRVTYLSIETARIIDNLPNAVGEGEK